MEFILLAICISILFLISSLFTLTYQKLIPSNGKLPPSPTPLPVIGNLLHFCKQQDQAHQAMASLAKIYGPVMSLKLGMTNLVIISSPDTAREALQKNDAAVSARLVPDNPHALRHHKVSIAWLSSSSPLWKNLRTVVTTHLMSARSLDMTRTIRQEKSRELMTYFHENAGKSIRLSLSLFGAMLNLTSNLLFSEDVLDLGSDSTEDFKELVASALEEIAKPNVSDFYPFLRALDLQGRRSIAKVYLERFYNYFDGIITRRLTGVTQMKENTGDFLDSLLKLHSDSNLDLRTIKGLLTDLFVAGSESGSITIEWAMAELLRNHSVMLKARAELKEKIGSKQVEQTDIPKLPYLHAIIKETMRLHPAGPLMLPHKVTEAGVEIGGFTLPKDARVMINVWAIGRDSTAWSEPDIFMPERFLLREVDFRGQDFKFIPFGSGRRLCPGLPLAVKTIPLMLASMLHEFEWILPDGIRHSDVDLKDRFGASLALATPLQAVPVPVIATD
ncbi:Cytochrome P450 76C4 [Rhynchospora pubera]|uniref:Cytochrome P450 76C4 n=1 Tax=Rhynchospora pubera TaxID=906938 RepID=A0AAV8HBE6_9POAL|nr:Cytochrome P450 76C4 [Rhynchospora pubera]